MGLDGIELIMAIEEQFGIELSDDEAVETSTPADLIAVILNKVQMADSATCMTRRAFYALRRALVQCCDRKRAEITPTAPLETLLPRPQRRQHWERLGVALNGGPADAGRQLGRLSRWPGLHRPEWLLALLTGISLAVWLVPLFWRWPGWVSFGLAVAVFVIGHRLTQPWGREFPRELATAGQLAQRLVGIAPKLFEPEGRRWRRSDVAQIVREITIEQLGLKPEQYREDARFVEDLGMG